MNSAIANWYFRLSLGKLLKTKNTAYLSDGGWDLTCCFHLTQRVD
jgi:hypothetical protein